MESSIKNFKSSLSKHKSLIIINIFFLVWIGFLLIISISSKRVVIFYDARYQKDVSSQFTSTLPWQRYIVEPFYGIGFILETKMEYIIGYTILFLIFRLGYLILIKKRMNFSEKFKLINYILKDFLRSSFIILGIMVIIILIIIGVGFFSMGFFFVNRYWNQILPIGIMFSEILIFLRGLYLLITFFNPRFKFKYSIKKRYQPPTLRINLIKKWRVFRKEFVFLIGTILLLLESHLIIMYTRFPIQRIETELEEGEFLFDFHVHTTMSDGWLTPQERVLWYIDHGISGAAFSDHDNIRGATIAKKYVSSRNLDFIVWIAQEWTDHENDIHMNIYGISEEIVPLESNVEGGPLALNASDMIKYVKKRGGYVTVNHYNSKRNEIGGLGVPYTYEHLLDWGVDGFEIVNGPNVQEKEIRDFCLKNNLICMGGSDVHSNEDLTMVIRLKLDNPENKSISNIFKNLRRNTHQVIAIELYPKKVNFPNEFNDMGGIVIEDFFEYIINISFFQLVSWMSWSIIFYLIFIISYRKFLKLDIEYLRSKIC